MDLLTLMITIIKWFFFLLHSLQAKEIQIRKQFSEAVKTQQRQYKVLKEHILHVTPKSEQKTVGKKLKEEQMKKLAALEDQYEASISEMLQQQYVSFCFRLHSLPPPHLPLLQSDPIFRNFLNCCC